MEFDQVLEAMLQGKKVTPDGWVPEAYLFLRSRTRNNGEIVIHYAGTDTDRPTGLWVHLFRSDRWTVVGESPAQRFSLSFSDILPGLKAGFKRYAYGEWVKWERKWIQGRNGVICDQDGETWEPCMREILVDKWGEVEVHPSDEYVENRGKDIANEIPENLTDPDINDEGPKGEAYTEEPKNQLELYHADGTQLSDAEVSEMLDAACEFCKQETETAERKEQRGKILRIGTVGGNVQSGYRLDGWEMEGGAEGVAVCYDDAPASEFDGVINGWPVEELRQLAIAANSSHVVDQIARVQNKALRERNAELEAEVKELTAEGPKQATFQLAACHDAAEGLKCPMPTHKGSYSWSEAYEAVTKLRTQWADAHWHANDLQSRLDSTTRTIDYLAECDKRQRDTIDYLQTQLAQVCADSGGKFVYLGRHSQQEYDDVMGRKTGPGKWRHNRKQLLEVVADARNFIFEAAGHFSDKETAEKAAELSLELSAVDTSQ